MKHFLFIGVLLMTSCTRTLPPYVCIDDHLCTNTNVLREPAKTVEFPLSDEVCQALADLEAKYDHEENIAGLAAPQIGYPYKIIVFAVPDDPNLKKFRNDLVQTMSKTIWINPTYTPLSNEKRKDMEGCFSIKKYVGQVERYTHIAYCATTVDGKKVTGEATGFLARVIQHEVDHLNGILS
jgi:peptide deformylase